MVMESVTGDSSFTSAVSGDEAGEDAVLPLELSELEL